MIADTKGLFLTCIFLFFLNSLLLVDEQLKTELTKLYFIP